MRRREIERRRSALALLPGSSIEIEPSIGHTTAPSGALVGAASVVTEVQRIRSTIFRAEQGDGKPYLIDFAVTAEDLSPAILSFALSEAVVTPAARYLGLVPFLGGITILASPYVPSEGFSGSQLFHCDYEELRQVKVFVNCSSVTTDNGPLTGISAAASQRIKRAIGYRYGGRAFRRSDDQVLPLLRPGELTAFEGPPETTTFIDTSTCLHFGSRVDGGAAERLVVQFQYVTPSAFDLLLRGDVGRPFAQLADGRSALQRLVLGATA